MWVLREGINQRRNARYVVGGIVIDRDGIYVVSIHYWKIYSFSSLLSYCFLSCYMRKRSKEKGEDAAAPN
jgi:hypothetical protein